MLSVSGSSGGSSVMLGRLCVTDLTIVQLVLHRTVGLQLQKELDALTVGKESITKRCSALGALQNEKMVMPRTRERFYFCRLCSKLR